jgi:hypothetical protein
LIASVNIQVAVSNKNPLPSDIKKQLGVPVIYPKTTKNTQVIPNSLKYQSSQRTLTFTVNDEGNNVIITEQPMLSSSTSPTLAYYQSIGLNPVTEIQTKIGLAVLVNFYTTGNYDSVGQNAVLASDGTLLVAHPSKNISAEDWKTFLNNFKQYK